MFYLTSDLHGGQNIAGLETFVATCGADDWLLILGDLGLLFEKTAENKAFSEWFISLPCNIAFIDGNHENFDYLERFPEEDWMGGRVHRISKNIVHLMRGYVFTLDGKSFFTMGGCGSSQKWKDQGLWWPQEDPTVQELQRGYDALAAHENCVDYVLTHKYPKEPLENPERLSLNGLYAYIDKEVAYGHWYSGHWHKEWKMDAKHTVVFDSCEPLEK